MHAAAKLNQSLLLFASYKFPQLAPAKRPWSAVCLSPTIGLLGECLLKERRRKFTLSIGASRRLEQKPRPTLVSSIHTSIKLAVATSRCRRRRYAPLADERSCLIVVG